MEKKRIVITGIGVVAPNGIGKEEFWANCFAGVSGIKPITLFDTSKYRCHWAGEVSNFQPEKYLGPKGLRNLDRTTLLALVAAKLAIDDAKLEITDENRNDIGVVLGSTMGSVHSISEFDKEGLREGPRYVNPAHFPNTVINSPASQVAIRFGLKGLNTTISTGFTASLDAFGYAIDMLRLGHAKALLVGGVEELCIQTYLGFYKLGLLATTPNGSRPEFTPFSDDAQGTLLGEGAAFFVVEPLEQVAARSAQPLAELQGYGMSFNPKALYRYDSDGTAGRKAMLAALNDAGLAAQAIDAISTCANAVRGCDVAERRVLEEVFGVWRGDARRLLATKALVGESFSADGALRLASALGELIQGRLRLDKSTSRQRNVVIDGAGPTAIASALVARTCAPVRSKRRRPAVAMAHT